MPWLCKLRIIAATAAEVATAEDAIAESWEAAAVATDVCAARAAAGASFL